MRRDSTLKRRLFNVAAAVSLFLLAATVLLWIRSDAPGEGFYCDVIDASGAPHRLVRLQWWDGMIPGSHTRYYPVPTQSAQLVIPTGTIQWHYAMVNRGSMMQGPSYA